LGLRRRRIGHELAEHGRSAWILYGHQQDPPIEERVLSTEEQREHRALAGSLCPVDDVDVAAVQTVPLIGLDEVAAQLGGLVLGDPRAERDRLQRAALAVRPRISHRHTSLQPFDVRVTMHPDAFQP